ncbi:MAG: cobalamin biosynthesis protein [Paracoccaceae bacterium]
MIVAGIGFRKQATVQDLAEALRLTGQLPNALASIVEKTAQPQLQQLADGLNLPLLSLAEQEIAGEPTLTCSPRIKARFGTGSLAEAAALAGARQNTKGATVRLLAPRVITPNGMATAALAERK